MLSRLLNVTMQRLHWYRDVSTGPEDFVLGRKFRGTGMPTVPSAPGDTCRLIGVLLSGESILFSASLSFPSESLDEEARMM